MGKFKIKDVLEGWSNYIDRPEIPLAESKKRAEACIKCDSAKKKAILTMVKDELKEIQGMCCTACGGCPLSAKIRSKSECPKNKW